MSHIKFTYISDTKQHLEYCEDFYLNTIIQGTETVTETINKKLSKIKLYLPKN